MLTRTVLPLLITIVLAPTFVLAQNESSGISVAVGDGFSAGFRFPLSGTVTLRPSLMLFDSRQERGAPSQTINTNLNYAVAVDVLVHTERSALIGVTSYVGGGVGFGYSEFRSETKNVPSFFGTYSDIQRRLLARGIVGAQYSLGEHFSFFGEVGLSAGESPKFDGSNRYVSTFSRLGLNLLF